MRRGDGNADALTADAKADNLPNDDMAKWRRPSWLLGSPARWLADCLGSFWPTEYARH